MNIFKKVGLSIFGHFMAEGISQSYAEYLGSPGLLNENILSCNDYNYASQIFVNFLNTRCSNVQVKEHTSLVLGEFEYKGRFFRFSAMKHYARCVMFNVAFHTDKYNDPDKLFDVCNKINKEDNIHQVYFQRDANGRYFFVASRLVLITPHIGGFDTLDNILSELVDFVGSICKGDTVKPWTSYALHEFKMEDGATLETVEENLFEGKTSENVMTLYSNDCKIIEETDKYVRRTMMNISNPSATTLNYNGYSTLLSFLKLQNYYMETYKEYPYNLTLHATINKETDPKLNFDNDRLKQICCLWNQDIHFNVCKMVIEDNGSLSIISNIIFGDDGNTRTWVDSFGGFHKAIICAKANLQN